MTFLLLAGAKIANCQTWGLIKENRARDTTNFMFELTLENAFFKQKQRDLDQTILSDKSHLQFFNPSIGMAFCYLSPELFSKNISLCSELRIFFSGNHMSTNCMLGINHSYFTAGLMAGTHAIRTTEPATYRSWSRNYFKDEGLGAYAEIYHPNLRACISRECIKGFDYNYNVLFSLNNIQKVWFGFFRQEVLGSGPEVVYSNEIKRPWRIALRFAVPTAYEKRMFDIGDALLFFYRLDIN